MPITIDTINRLSTTQKILILSGSIVIITIVFIYFFYLPKKRVLNDKIRRLSDLRIERNEKEAIAKNLPKFKEEVKKLNSELKNALIKLPNEKEIPIILRNISDIGKEYGLEFLLFKPLPENRKDFYAEVPIEMRVLGSYHQVATFFDKIGSLPRIISVKNIDIKWGKRSGSRILLNVSCLAKTYRFIKEGK
jgi:type IV pilus assembly protein PilO